MLIRTIPAVAILSAYALFSAQAEPLNRVEPVQVAFVDLSGPRGITLSNGGEDDEATEPAAEAKPKAPVTFGTPFVDIDDALDGGSIRDLISGTPLYAPIEGLPESLWKDKECSSCHAWTQETLCDQGLFYGKQGLGAVQRKEHPYGGAFKREIMRWADRGCE